MNNILETTATVAQVAGLLTNTQEEKNAVQLGIIKAGAGAGLDVPADWDGLEEDEKTKRLAGVLAIMNEPMSNGMARLMSGEKHAYCHLSELNLEDITDEMREMLAGYISSGCRARNRARIYSVIRYHLSAHFSRWYMERFCFSNYEGRGLRCTYTAGQDATSEMANIRKQLLK